MHAYFSDINVYGIPKWTKLYHTQFDSQQTHNQNLLSNLHGTVVKHAHNNYGCPLRP